MNKVITVNLNGRAFQVEEGGFNALRDYLSSAEKKLQNDPDKSEVMADLEQALGEKLDRFVGPRKTVVSQARAEEVIKEMGPVQADEKQEGTAGDENASAGQRPQDSGAKRLYRVREGAMLFGVCTGLAAYFDADVTLVRIIFVALTVLTHGFGALIYFIMLLVIPHANTSAEKAAAFGAPFTAQEFINRARSEYQKFKGSGQVKQWKQQWKQHTREEKREMKQEYRAQTRSQCQGSPLTLSPFLALLIGLVSVFWVIGLVTLVSKGVIYTLVIPAAIPLWIAILGWLCVYALVMSPLKATRFAYRYDGNSRYHHHEDGFLEGIAWTAFLVILGWALWRYVPGSHIYFQKVIMWWNRVRMRIRKDK